MNTTVDNSEVYDPERQTAEARIPTTDGSSKQTPSAEASSSQTPTLASASSPDTLPDGYHEAFMRAMNKTISLLGERGLDIPAIRHSEVLNAIVNAKRDIAERTEAVGIAGAETISIFAKPGFWEPTNPDEPTDPVFLYRLGINTEYTKSKGSTTLWLPQVELKITVQPSEPVKIEISDVVEKHDAEEQGEYDTDDPEGGIELTDPAVIALTRLLDEFGL